MHVGWFAVEGNLAGPYGDRFAAGSRGVASTVGVQLLLREFALDHHWQDSFDKEVLVHVHSVSLGGLAYPFEQEPFDQVGVRPCARSKYSFHGRDPNDVVWVRSCVGDAEAAAPVEMHWRKSTRPCPFTIALIRTLRCWLISSRYRGRAIRSDGLNTDPLADGQYRA